MAGEYGYMANPTIYSAPGTSSPGFATTPAGYNPGYFGPTQYGSSAPTSYTTGAPAGYAYSASGLVPIGSGQGGGAGIQAYNPAIGGPTATRSFQAPSFTNSMSNWYSRGNANDVANSVYANVSSPYATEMAAMGGYPGSVDSGGRGGSGGGVDRFGNPAGTASQGSFNSPYDLQNTAYNMMYKNQISPALGLNNLARYANAFNNFGFGNPNAGVGMASVAGAESSGNAFAYNPRSQAFGMNQWSPQGSNYPRYANAMSMLGSSQYPGYMQNSQGAWVPSSGDSGSSYNSSPEMQAALASSEIRGGGLSPSIYNTLNNPNSSMTQMQNSGIGQFEGLQGNPQMAGDQARAASYANQLTPSALANAAASIAQYRPQQGQGRY